MVNYFASLFAFNWR